MNGGEIDYSQLNNIDWNKDTVDRFQEVVDTSTQQFYCGDAEVSKWPPLIFSSISCIVFFASEWNVCQNKVSRDWLFLHTS